MKSSSSSNASRLCAINDGAEHFKEILPTLTKEVVSPTSMEIVQYKGFWLPCVFLEATLSLSKIFKARPYDIYLCSCPKTGTTWLKALAFSIMTRDNFYHDNSKNPLLNKVPHDCLPFLEADYATNPNFLETELPLLSTHLPYSLLPKSILDSDCKIIYICREPKDTFVSMWHFLPGVQGSTNSEVARAIPVTLEQQFKSFCEGKSFYGPYWNHVSEYWKASIDRPERVFFLKYEDLKRDTVWYVKKLSEFMGKPFSKDEETQGVAEKIVSHCNIQSLSNLEVNKTGSHRPQSGSIRVNNSAFFRKGKVGDWKNLLTKDMVYYIDHITQEKFQSLGLTFPVNACDIV